MLDTQLSFVILLSNLKSMSKNVAYSNAPKAKVVIFHARALRAGALQAHGWGALLIDRTSEL